MATWIQNASQSWLVLELTNSAFFLGLVSSVQFIPTLLFSLFAGVMIDRHNKRDLIVATQTALMIFAFLLAGLIYFKRIQYWHILLIAFLTGVAQSIDTPARQAFVIEMTSPEDLMNAVALNSVIFNLARIVGPAAAGLLIDRIGFFMSFFLNGVSFIAVIAGLLLMRVNRPTSKRESKSVMRDLAEGLRYIRGNRKLATIIVTVGVISLFVLNFNVLVPAFARDVLHQEASGYGFLTSAMGLGAFVGALTLATFASRERGVTRFLAGAILLPLFTIVLGLTRQYMSSVATIAFLGFSMILFTTTANATTQLTAPDELRGRVVSVYMLIYIGVTPAGAFLAGWLASRLGPGTALVILGSVGLGFAIYVASRRAALLETPRGSAPGRTRGHASSSSSSSSPNKQHGTRLEAPPAGRIIESAKPTQPIFGRTAPHLAPAHNLQPPGPGKPLTPLLTVQGPFVHDHVAGIR